MVKKKSRAVKVSEAGEETYALIPITLAETYIKLELSPTFLVQTKTLTCLCRYAAIALGGSFHPSSH